MPVPRVQLRCLLRVPGTPIPRDAILDTGAPLTCFPERIWQPFREGVDFEWCPFAPGVQPPAGQMAGWRFTFRMARFLVPLALMDYSTEVERPDVFAAFATGDPPAHRATNAPPPVIIGLWGGLLEGSRLAIGRDPATGQVTGALEFP